MSLTKITMRWWWQTALFTATGTWGSWTALDSNVRLEVVCARDQYSSSVHGMVMAKGESMAMPSGFSWVHSSARM